MIQSWEMDEMLWTAVISISMLAEQITRQYKRIYLAADARHIADLQEPGSRAAAKKRKTSTTTAPLPLKKRHSSATAACCESPATATSILAAAAAAAGWSA